MSSPMVKGVKRSPLRSTSRQSSASSSKSRSLAGKSVRLKPITKRSATGKAPAKKAKKSTAASTSKGRVAKKKTAPVKTRSVAKSRPPAKTRKVAAKAIAPSRSTKAKPVPVKPLKAHVRKAPPVLPPPKPKPTRDEAAALKDFQKAHKEFALGRFAEARNQFRTLVEKYSGVSEVTARARTYLAVAENRLRTETMLPRDADSLYDRGVIELNRGEYVAAQELFERALKREPTAGHVHYGLAATRARLGSIDLALESLRSALDAQPSLRIRAQHDLDLNALRNDPDFDKLVFAPRP